MTEIRILMDKDWADYLAILGGVALPILTLIFGVIILRVTKKLEKTQWRSQKIIEKRIEEWDVIRKEFNDIFCYCVRVGHWKTLSPTDVIERKRIVDRNMHLARPYFSKEFFRAYLSFMKVCFAQYQGHGVDAKIKSPVWEHQNAYEGQWNENWDDLFFEDVSSESELWDAYDNMLLKVADELESRHV